MDSSSQQQPARGLQPVSWRFNVKADIMYQIICHHTFTFTSQLVTYDVSSIHLAIGPAGGLLLLPLELHALVAPEGDHGVEVGPAALEPAVGEEAVIGPAAVDLHTLGLAARPQPVRVARPGVVR